MLRVDGFPRVAGLCLKCAQHEAVLADTHGNQHVQTIDRLTKSVEMSTILKIQYIILRLSNAKIVTTKMMYFTLISSYLSNILGTVMSCW